MTLQTPEIITTPITAQDPQYEKEGFGFRCLLNSFFVETWMFTNLDLSWRVISDVGMSKSDKVEMLVHEKPDFYFVLLNDVSSYIRTMVEQQDRNTIEHFAQNKYYSLKGIKQFIQDDIKSERNSQIQSNIPIKVFELNLYTCIAEGAQPWSHVRSFYENIKSSLNTNPSATMALLESFGMDLIFPNFPVTDESQQNSLQNAMDEWYSSQNINGIDFLCETLRKVGQSTQRPGETNDQYVTRIFRILPGLEEYADLYLSKGQNQRPEYYMQICYALAHLPLYREVEFHEPHEAMTALIVKDGKILGAAYNVPTKHEDVYDHAETLALMRAEEKVVFPLEGASLFSLVEPCVGCAYVIRTYNLREVVYGPRTEMGGDTKAQLFTVGDKTPDCPSGDWLFEQGKPYFPIPPIVKSDILYDKIARLIVYGQKWKKFIRPKST